MMSKIKNFLMNPVVGVISFVLLFLGLMLSFMVLEHYETTRGTWYLHVQNDAPGANPSLVRYKVKSLSACRQAILSFQSYGESHLSLYCAPSEE